MSTRAHQSGVYAIEQIGTTRVYIGSSADISSRWYAHRRELKAGTHHSSFLQNAWAKHGPDAFMFRVLDECHPSELLDREQEYIDALRPVFNVNPLARSRLGSHNTEEVREKMREIHRARAALITHCPKGHEYDQANTFLNKSGDRLCRACARARSNAAYASETPEARERRLERVKDYNDRTRDERIVKQREYAATRKEEKRAYDQTRADLKHERDKERRANRTPEQLEAIREAKRADYWRNRDKNVQDLRERYRRTHPVPEPATACKNGHPYTDDSFRMWRGKKLCKVCRAITKRAYRERLNTPSP